MKRLDDFCLFASNSCRSRAYLDLLLQGNIKPSKAIVLELPSVADNADNALFESTFFNNTTPLVERLQQNKIEYVTCKADSIRDSKILSLIKSISEKYLIFSIPGQILNQAYFNLNKLFIHIHPGQLPEYRGSTPMYYSILAENKIVCSAIFLSEKLDTGLVIGQQKFNIPSDKSKIDTEYDPWIRATLLKNVISDYITHNQFSRLEQSSSNAETYYIIHPVLKCLAIT